MTPLKSDTMANGDQSDEDGSVNSLPDDSGVDNLTESSPVGKSSLLGKKRKHEKDTELSKGKKHKKSDLRAPPSAEELLFLKETENLFQSNVFRLQITELLSETRLKKSYKRHFDQWFLRFTNFLDNLDDSKEREVKNVKWLKKHGIHVPIFLPDDLTGSFKFSKPIRTSTVGSFVHGTTIGSPIIVNVVLVMPRAIFKKSDKLNLQYSVKRSLYLSHVAAHLRNSDLIAPGTEIQFTALHGDALKPCLVFRPNEKTAKELEVVVSAVPQAGVFRSDQFTPGKLNIDTAEGINCTPHYNSTVCEDLVLEENEAMTLGAFEANQNLRDAAVLIGIWLKQRSLSEGYGGFNMDIVCFYLAYMMKTRRVNLSMSSNQVLRSFWLDISKSDWTSIGPSLSTDPTEEQLNLQKEFHQNHDVVFIDVTGYHNLAFRLTKSSFMKVKKEAAHALNLLNKADTNSFQALFLRNTPFLHQYDNVLCFVNTDVISRAVLAYAPHQLKVDFCLQNIPIFVRMLEQLFEKGLTNRMSTFSIGYPSDPRWNLSHSPKSYQLCGNLLIGVKLNSDCALSVIDKGPSSNTPEGDEFRKFWGSKCQLRRFKDGSISESVIWADNHTPIGKRRQIIKEILAFLLESKLGIPETSYGLVGFQLSQLTSLCFAHERTPEESCIALHKAFTRFSQDLHDLALPLEIVSVHCISSAYRFTDPFPPTKSHFIVDRLLCTTKGDSKLLKKDADKLLPPFVPTVDLVVQMSISSKWPEDPNACKRLVAAFYLEIASAFNKKHLVTQVTPDFLIVFKEGLLFRIFLAYSKQIGNLKKRISEQGVKQYRDTEESIAAEKKFINLPKLTGALYGLSQYHLAFGATCVLAKRWVSSHLFSETHFPSIAIELLVAYMFLAPQSIETTMQPLPMFLRFLKMMSATNWHSEPVIVNFNDTLDKDGIYDIEKFFNTNRETLPPLFIATPYDTTGVLWTKKAPSIPALVRLAKLALASLQICEETLILPGDKSLSVLTKVFTTSMSPFHVVIRLDKRVVTRRHQTIDFDEQMVMKKIRKSMGQIPVVEFDPVAKYVKLLEESYSDLALFFYNEYGGSEVGVLLKPQYTAEASYKVSSFEGRRPEVKEGSVTVLKPALGCLVEGFKLLGDGLVDHVIVNPIGKQFL